MNFKKKIIVQKNKLKENDLKYNFSINNKKTSSENDKLSAYINIIYQKIIFPKCISNI